MTNVAMKISPVIFRLWGLEVRWYAVFILLGALSCYLASQWAMKRGGYPKSILETLFYIAFPAGIVGARLWWCIADASSPWRNGDFWGFFRVWEGGLAVQGGVLLGAAVGILHTVIKHKEVNIYYAIDAVIPNILIAQSIGRWGNFFNQEVYGACVEASTVNYLPGFIKNQMMGGFGSGIECASTEMAHPLFLYEALLNLIGWVLITFVLRLYWKKGFKNGDLAALYLIWYGICRACLEPLRNPEFIMNGLWGIPVSIYTSILFIILGVGLMVFLRVKDWKRKKKIVSEEEGHD